MCEKNSDKNQECEFCRLREKGFTEREIQIIYEEKAEALIEKYGFLYHYVPLDGGVDCHTHGLVGSFGHMELQIVLPISPKDAGHILHNIVDKIKKGESFYDGLVVQDGILSPGYPAKFEKRLASDGEVLRIMICDEKGILPGEKGCRPMYDMQKDFSTAY